MSKLPASLTRTPRKTASHPRPSAGQAMAQLGTLTARLQLHTADSATLYSVQAERLWLTR